MLLNLKLVLLVFISIFRAAELQHLWWASCYLELAFYPSLLTPLSTASIEFEPAMPNAHDESGKRLAGFWIVRSALQSIHPSRSGQVSMSLEFALKLACLFLKCSGTLVYVSEILYVHQLLLCFWPSHRTDHSGCQHLW